MATSERRDKLWQQFVDQFALSAEQRTAFERYYELLMAWNEKFNLTAITSVAGVLGSHFADSLALQDALDLTTIKTIVDVGSGAGFPGLPLKIIFPHLQVILIEVSAKKRQFLQVVIEELGLEGVEICALDWRTFVRTTEAEVDLMLARASVDPKELCRMFSPISAYKGATLVYWAAADWQAEGSIAKYVQREVPYAVKRKKRKLVLFAAK